MEIEIISKLLTVLKQRFGQIDIDNICILENKIVIHSDLGYHILHKEDETSDFVYKYFRRA